LVPECTVISGMKTLKFAKKKYIYISMPYSVQL